MAFVTVAGMALVAVPAQAAPGDAVAAGSAGAVSITRGDKAPVVLDPVAPCSTDGTPQGSAGNVSVPDVISFADTTSTCTIDAAGEVASAEVTGGRFRFDALEEHGGPRLRLATYTVRCDTTLKGSGSTLGFTGLTGVRVPEELPPNHLVTIPGGPDGKPMATVTFNEVVSPNPADGSMTVHLMHLRMFPEGGPATGDAYAGTVHCAPPR